MWFRFQCCCWFDFWLCLFPCVTFFLSGANGKQLHCNFSATHKAYLLLLPLLLLVVLLLLLLLDLNCSFGWHFCLLPTVAGVDATKATRNMLATLALLCGGLSLSLSLFVYVYVCVRVCVGVHQQTELLKRAVAAHQKKKK